MSTTIPGTYIDAVSPITPPVRFFRRHLDDLAAGLFALLWLTGVVSGPVPADRRDLAVFAVCGLLVTVPLAWRRRAPMSVALVVYAAGLAQAYLRASDLPIGFLIATIVTAYSLGAFSPAGWRSRLTLAVVLIAVTVTDVPHNDSGLAGLVLTPALFLLLPWAAGRLVTRLRSERVALQRLTIRLEQEQEDVARASVVEERARIARELHDIVAHSISVMVVQAGAAEQFVDPSSPARQPLQSIRTTGQQALVEMRHLLGVLRTDDTGMTLAPQPGLGSLDVLVDAARRSGLEVTVTVTGTQVPLPPGVDVAAYRLVQESFSNIRKHARAHCTTLTLGYERRCLMIDVADDGVGASPIASIGGHGLIGMRERVSLYGGRLESGPAPTGGWRVQAQLPLTS